MSVTLRWSSNDLSVQLLTPTSQMIRQRLKSRARMNVLPVRIAGGYDRKCDLCAKIVKAWYKHTLSVADQYF